MNDSFYIYRLPGETEVHSGAADYTLEGIHPDGFVIGAFSNTHKYPILTIPNNKSLIKIPDFSPDHNICNISTTSYSERKDSIIYIQKKLREEEIRTGIRGKVVSARVLKINRRINPSEAFENLCTKYKNAFVFLFYTPHTGMWLGASPELLLNAQDDTLYTMALAGTRPASEEDNEWDQKNIEEQEIVAKYIFNTIKQQGFSPIYGDTYSRKAGPVEHICTQLTASLKGADCRSENIYNLISALSPTPALCGYPISLAKDTIKNTEKFDRDYYGGFCGPIKDHNEFSIFVNLRNARVFSDYLLLYAGGGITLLSDVDDEWNETEKKLETLLDCLEPIQ